MAAGYPVVVRHWQELAVFYGQVKLLYVGIFGFVGAVLVVIVILSAAIVMTMAVTERTREIGTLRALGTRPSGILRHVPRRGGRDRARGLCSPACVFALVVRAGLNASGIILPPPPGATHGVPINVKFYPLAYVAGPARDAPDDGDRVLFPGAAGVADLDRGRADACLRAQSRRAGGRPQRTTRRGGSSEGRATQPRYGALGRRGGPCGRPPGGGPAQPSPRR